jgi:hypothetical protein
MSRIRALLLLALCAWRRSFSCRRFDAQGIPQNIPEKNC